MFIQMALYFKGDIGFKGFEFNIKTQYNISGSGAFYEHFAFQKSDGRDTDSFEQEAIFITLKQIPIHHY